MKSETRPQHNLKSTSKARSPKGSKAGRSHAPMPNMAKLAPGRPSKLTPKQWAEIGRRLALGESTSALAREFGVGKARISERFSGKTQELKTLASQVVNLDTALDQLPDSERGAVLTLADYMKATGNNLAAAARAGSATSALLAGLAHGKAVQLNPDSVDMKGLQEIAALTQTANQAATIGTALVTATKNSRLEEAPPPAPQKQDLSMLTMAELRVARYIALRIEGGPQQITNPNEAQDLIGSFEKCMAEVKVGS